MLYSQLLYVFETLHNKRLRINKSSGGSSLDSSICMQGLLCAAVLPVFYLTVMTQLAPYYGGSDR